MAGHATLAPVRIARQNDSTAITRCEVRLFFRVLNRNTRLKAVPEDFPQATQQTEHFPLLQLRKREYNGTRHEQIQQGEGEHELPAPSHQLVKAWSRRSCTQEDEQTDECQSFDAKPDRRRQNRSQPSPEIQKGNRSGNQRDANVFAYKKHSELHARVLGMESGNEFAFRLGEIER